MGRGSLSAQRAAAILVWVPVLLAQPVGERSSGAAGLVTLLMVAAAAAGCILSVLRSWPEPTTLSNAAWLSFAAVVTAGSASSAAWSRSWILVAMAAGAALRPRMAVVAVVMCSVAAAFFSRSGATLDALLEQAFMVALAGITAGVISRLVITTDRLRRARGELAVAAVARERDRVARDLHDVLGHTLSVMVVKAAAVQRLITRDPQAATAHAADIEQIGRTALGQVRETIQAVGAPSLVTELQSSRQALATAGIETSVAVTTEPPTEAEPALAWALREAVTNVIRHADAQHCAIEVAREPERVRLTVHDDGRGASRDALEGGSGLSGLRRRMQEAGGDLAVSPASSSGGFTLTAWVTAPEEGA